MLIILKSMLCSFKKTIFMIFELVKGHCIDSQRLGAGTPSECVQGLQAGLKARASQAQTLMCIALASCYCESEWGGRL